MKMVNLDDLNSDLLEAINSVLSKYKCDKISLDSVKASVTLESGSPPRISQEFNGIPK